MKKRILSVFLCLCMIVGMLPAVEVKAEGGNIVSTLEDLKAAIADASYSDIQIAGNITITEALEIPAGRTVTIQSVGGPYTLTKDFAGVVFNVKGNLTLQNVIIEATGYNAYNSGMAAKVDGSSATLTLQDGVTIQKFTCNNNAIVSIVNGASLTMENGSTICNNTAYMNGGGVYVTNGTFTMNGGIISENTSDSRGTGNKYGGGVYITGSNSVFTMNGGSIINNTADYGGGIYMFSGTFNIGGDVTIKENKEGSNDSNVDLRAGNVIHVVSELTNADQIGLSLNFGEKNALYTKEVFTVVTCGTEDEATANAQKFKPDSAYHTITPNGTNIDMEVPGYTVTVVAGTGMACSSGEQEQTVEAGTALASIIYNVNEDYYFPTDYTVSGLDGTGILVTRNSYTKITVSGTPTADVTINITDATEKTEQKPQPTGVTFVATGAKKGELRGISSEMEYLTWLGSYWPLGNGTRVFDSLSAGETITVRTKGGDTEKPSEPIVFSLTKKETPTGVTAVACSEAGVNDGRLIGVTSAMEYKKYDEADDMYDPGHYDPELGETPDPDVSNWISGTGSDITGLEAGKYRVRAKAEGTALASEELILTVGESGGVTVANYTISATVQPATGGSITGTGTYAENTSVTLTATPNSGCRFINWTENGVEVSTSAAYSFIVTGNRNLVANFGEDNPNGEGTGGTISPAPNPDPIPMPNPTPTPTPSPSGPSSGGTTDTETEQPDVKVETSEKTKPDGSKVTITVATKEDGTSIKVKEVKDVVGKPVRTKVTVKVYGEKEKDTLAYGFKVTGELIKEVKGLLNNTDTTVTMVILNADNEVCYRLVADTVDLKAGNKVYPVIVDKKSGDYILTDKEWEVSKEGNLEISMSVKKEYTLINETEMKQLTEEILDKVVLENKVCKLAKGEKVKIDFSKELNMDNVKSITYSNADKQIAKAGKKGFVRGKKAGKTKINVIVQLNNGVTKNLTLKVKVK